jgi:nucleotide-binding universal stress UspA family protein
VEFSSLLVAVDDSPESRDALRWAASNMRDGGTVTLAMVSGNPSTRTADYLADAWEEAFETEGSDLVVAYEALHSHDVGHAVVAAAKACHAEAVVVGARKLQRWHPKRLSTTAAEIHHACEAPLIAVRDSAAVGDRICVGVDGTDTSWKALRWIVGRCGVGVEINVVWVLEATQREGAQMPVTAGIDVTRRAVASYLQHEVAEIAAASQATVRTEVIVGSPLRDILIAAESSGVLAMGHDHHSALGRAFGESVSLRLLHQFERTTIVIP